MSKESNNYLFNTHAGNGNLLYLAIMGELILQTHEFYYCQHYGPGNTYHNFVAVDASRAFITGEFDTQKSKSGALDHVLSLSPR